MNHEWIKRDFWFETIFRYPCFAVSAPDDPAENSSLFGDKLALLRNGDAFFAFTKVSPSRLEQISLFENAGFHLVDTNVQFDKPIERNKKLTGNCLIRFAHSADEQAAVLLARASFQFSRFHLDRKITNEIANNVKGEWVRNYFKGSRGDAMVMAEIDGKLVGFLQLIKRLDGTLVIDLIAVDNSHRRKGIAGDMISFAENCCDNFTKIIVGTQLANVPSMRMYEGLGFRICASSYVFHCHHTSLEGSL